MDSLHPRDGDSNPGVIAHDQSILRVFLIHRNGVSGIPPIEEATLSLVHSVGVIPEEVHRARRMQKVFIFKIIPVGEHHGPGFTVPNANHCLGLVRQLGSHRVIQLNYELFGIFLIKIIDNFQIDTFFRLTRLEEQFPINTLKVGAIPGTQSVHIDGLVLHSCGVLQPTIPPHLEYELLLGFIQSILGVLERNSCPGQILVAVINQQLHGSGPEQKSRSFRLGIFQADHNTLHTLVSEVVKNGDGNCFFTLSRFKHDCPEYILIVLAWKLGTRCTGFGVVIDRDHPVYRPSTDNMEIGHLLLIGFIHQIVKLQAVFINRRKSDRTVVVLD